MENRKPGAENQKAAHKRNFCHHSIRHKTLQIQSCQINTSLPQKKHDGRQGDADSVSRSQNHGSDQIQSSVGKQKRIISADSAFDRTKNRQGSDTKQQNRRGKSLAQILVSGFSGEPVESAVDIQLCSRCCSGVSEVDFNLSNTFLCTSFSYVLLRLIHSLR